MVKIVSSIAAAVLSAVLAPAAFAQTTGEPVRLRLALDHEGRLYLSTEPAALLPPPLVASPLPAPGDDHGRPLAASSAMAIDFSAPAQDLALPGGCLATSGPLAGLGAFGCDLAGFGGGLPGVVQGGDVVIRFDSADAYGFDLSYGLGWLDSHDGSLPWGDPAHVRVVDSSVLLPGWIGPVLGQPEWRAERFGVGGYLWLTPGLQLSLGFDQAQGPLSMFQVDPVIDLTGTGGMPWQLAQQDSVSLGLGGERFQGTLTGRQLRPASPGAGPSQDSLDLGFSWRMPWRAALEFGARNLIVKPRKADEAQQPEGDLRVPYIRYHQEL